MRWEDDIERHAGLTWKRQAQNRDTWEEIRETYIRKWIEEVWEEGEEEEKEDEEELSDIMPLIFKQNQCSYIGISWLLSRVYY